MAKAKKHPDEILSEGISVTVTPPMKRAIEALGVTRRQKATEMGRELFEHAVNGKIDRYLPADQVRELVVEAVQAELQAFRVPEAAPIQAADLRQIVAEAVQGEFRAMQPVDRTTQTAELVRDVVKAEVATAISGLLGVIKEEISQQFKALSEIVSKPVTPSSSWDPFQGAPRPTPPARSPGQAFSAEDILAEFMAGFGDKAKSKGNLPAPDSLNPATIRGRVLDEAKQSKLPKVQMKGLLTSYEARARMVVADMPKPGRITALSEDSELDRLLGEMNKLVGHLDPNDSAEAKQFIEASQRELGEIISRNT